MDCLLRRATMNARCLFKLAWLLNYVGENVLYTSDPVFPRIDVLLALVISQMPLRTSETSCGTMIWHTSVCEQLSHE